MRHFLLILLIAVLLPVSGAAQGVTYPPLPVGAEAPDFSLGFATKDSLGMGDISLSSFKGRNVILAFYPADWSGGCTKEVCTLRDNFAELSQLNAVVLGISGDYPYSHHEWAKYHTIPFLLLSDHRHRVAPVYHSYNETTGYNKRTVYIIDDKGMVAYVDLEYSTRDMVSFDKLKAALSHLTSGNKN